MGDQIYVSCGDNELYYEHEHVRIALMRGACTGWHMEKGTEVGLDREAGRYTWTRLSNPLDDIDPSQMSTDDFITMTAAELASYLVCLKPAQAKRCVEQIRDPLKSGGPGYERMVLEKAYDIRQTLARTLNIKHKAVAKTFVLVAEHALEISVCARKELKKIPDRIIRDIASEFLYKSSCTWDKVYEDDRHEFHNVEVDGLKVFPLSRIYG